MGKHTQEPLSHYGGGIMRGNAHVAEIENTGNDEADLDLGDRLAACYNALAGIENPEAFVAKVRELVEAWAKSDGYDTPTEQLQDLDLMLQGAKQ